MQVKGELAVVTGASSGIGLSVTRALAAAGAGVAMIARHRNKLEAARAGLGGLARRCTVHPCDVGSWRAVEATFKRIVAERGRPAILVNNAGISAVTPFAQMEPAEMERMVRTNVIGLLFCTRAALVPMRAARRGVIVNVGSIAGLFAIPLMSTYSATKWAVTGLSESLNAELSSEGIHVGVVCPAIVETPLVSREEERTGLSVPERMTLKPETVAKEVLEVIRKEQDVVAVPRALGTVAALRPTLGPFVRWVARESTALLKPRLRKPAAKPRKRRKR